MNDSTRIQGALICVAAAAAGLLFAIGILRESYWALAIPVAAGVAFVLGLAFWVGWTIATIRVEPEEAPEEPPAARPAEAEAEAEAASSDGRA